MRLRKRVLEDLRGHGVSPSDDDTLATLRERLNDAYLGEVRKLRERARQAEFPLEGYAERVSSLRERFALLGLPAGLWEEEPPREEGA